MLRPFYKPPGRADRRGKLVQVHLLLTPEERDKLAKLTHKRKQTAADVVRDLLREAR